MSAIDRDAERVLEEMIALGAVFDTVTTGGGDQPRWFYEARPGMRAPLRRYRDEVDWGRPGFQSAFVAAIRRRAGA